MPNRAPNHEESRKKTPVMNIGATSSGLTISQFVGASR
jgi:hypothetical protein